MGQTTHDCASPVFPTCSWKRHNAGAWELSGSHEPRSCNLKCGYFWFSKWGYISPAQVFQSSFHSCYKLLFIWGLPENFRHLCLKLLRPNKSDIFLEFRRCWDKDRCSGLRSILFQTGYENETLTSASSDSAGPLEVIQMERIERALGVSLRCHRPIAFTPQPFFSVDPKFHPPPPSCFNTSKKLECRNAELKHSTVMFRFSNPFWAIKLNKGEPCKMTTVQAKLSKRNRVNKMQGAGATCVKL